MYVDVKRRLFSSTPHDNFKRFVELVYERAPDLVFDLEKKTLLCNCITLKHGHDEALFIGRGSPIEIIEIKGSKTFPLVDVGSYVHRKDKICYVVTRKQEVRVIKSPVDGIVFYIGEVFSEIGQALYIIIVGEDNVIKLTRTP